MIRNIYRIFLLSPFFYWAYLILSGTLGAEPAKSLNHKMGEMALYFLILNLAIGLLIDLKFKWPTLLRPLLQSRRFIGVTAFFILTGHVFLYFVMEAFEFQAIEQILTKRYLIFGSLAFTIVLILALTSFDAVIRWMSVKKWKRLHRTVYVASLFFTIHILSIEKTDLIKYGLILGLLLLAQLIRWGVVYFRKRSQSQV